MNKKNERVVENVSPKTVDYTKNMIVVSCEPCFDAGMSFGRFQVYHLTFNRAKHIETSKVTRQILLALTVLMDKNIRIRKID